MDTNLYSATDSQISLIKKENVVKEQVKLASISGLGSEIWKDIDKYVENERQWD